MVAGAGIADVAGTSGLNRYMHLLLEQQVAKKPARHGESMPSEPVVNLTD